VLSMPAKARLVRGVWWYVEINHQGQSTKLTSWRNQRFTEEIALFMEQVINNQILTGHFRWDEWFPKLRQQYLFKEAYFQWLDHKPLAPSTRYNRSHAYKYFEHLAKKDVRDLIDWEWIRERYGDTAKAWALRQIIQAFLNWFHRAKHTDKRIDLMPINFPKKKTPYIPMEARWAIYNEMNDPYRDPTLMGIEMGMRIGEICALQWQDIDWDNDGITVCHTMSHYVLKDTRKGGDEVWLPLGAKSKETLLKLRQSRPAIAGFVFTHQSGTQVWTQQLSSEFKRCCRAVGVPGATFHHLRHSFLHDLSEAGASTKEAAALAGHRSEKTTEKYIGRWSKDKVRQIASLRGGKG